MKTTLKIKTKKHKRSLVIFSAKKDNKGIGIKAIDLIKLLKQL